MVHQNMVEANNKEMMGYSMGLIALLIWNGTFVQYYVG